MNRAYRQGTLVYDPGSRRMDIRFDPDHYCGGLHCGQSFEVFVNGRWTPTRIEMGEDWYLVDVPTRDLVGLRVRIPV